MLLLWGFKRARRHAVAATAGPNRFTLQRSAMWLLICSLVGLCCVSRSHGDYSVTLIRRRSVETDKTSSQ